MVITVNLKNHDWGSIYDFGQENFEITEQISVEKPSTSIEEFVERFNRFEIIPKIRNLNEEILKLGYQAHLKDFPLVTPSKESNEFRTGRNHMTSSVSNFSKEAVYMALLEEKIEDFYGHGTDYISPGRAIFRLNGIAVIPNSYKQSFEERDAMMKTVSKVFS